MRINGFKLYGGATITRAVDGAGQVYIACCARHIASDKFGFWIFRNGQPLPIEPFCTGRGSINNAGIWIAWTNEDYFEGQIPGFVPYPAAGQGPAGPQGPKGDPGPQGPAGPAGEGGGALAPADRTALDRLKSWLGIGQ